MGENTILFLSPLVKKPVPKNRFSDSPLMEGAKDVCVSFENITYSSKYVDKIYFLGK